MGIRSIDVNADQTTVGDSAHTQTARARNVGIGGGNVCIRMWERRGPHIDIIITDNGADNATRSQWTGRYPIGYLLVSFFTKRRFSEKVFRIPLYAHFDGPLLGVSCAAPLHAGRCENLCQTREICALDR